MRTKSDRRNGRNWRRDEKRLEAEERQKEYNKLTTEQKIERLDKMFGVGLGAKRERKRLTE